MPRLTPGNQQLLESPRPRARRSDPIGHLFDNNGLQSSRRAPVDEYFCESRPTMLDETSSLLDDALSETCQLDNKLRRETTSKAQLADILSSGNYLLEFSSWSASQTPATLRSLTKEQILRNDNIWELLNGELNYLNQLSALQEVYHNFPPKVRADIIFPNWDEFVSLHAGHLQSLLAAHSPDSVDCAIGAALISSLKQRTDDFGILYGNLLANFIESKAYLERLRSDPVCAQILQNSENIPALKRKNLLDCFQVINQRWTKVEVNVQNVLKNTSKNDDLEVLNLKEALRLVESVLHAAENALATKSNRVQLEIFRSGYEIKPETLNSKFPGILSAEMNDENLPEQLRVARMLWLEGSSLVHFDKLTLELDANQDKTKEGFAVIIGDIFFVLEELPTERVGQSAVEERRFRLLKNSHDIPVFIDFKRKSCIFREPDEAKSQRSKAFTFRLINYDSDGFIIFTFFCATMDARARWNKFVERAKQTAAATLKRKESRLLENHLRSINLRADRLQKHRSYLLQNNNDLSRAIETRQQIIDSILSESYESIANNNASIPHRFLKSNSQTALGDLSPVKRHSSLHRENLPPIDPTDFVEISAELNNNLTNLINQIKAMSDFLQAEVDPVVEFRSKPVELEAKTPDYQETEEAPRKNKPINRLVRNSHSNSSPKTGFLKHLILSGNEDIHRISSANLLAGQKNSASTISLNSQDFLTGQETPTSGGRSAALSQRRKPTSASGNSAQQHVSGNSSVRRFNPRSVSVSLSDISHNAGIADHDGFISDELTVNHAMLLHLRKLLEEASTAVITANHVTDAFNKLWNCFITSRDKLQLLQAGEEASKGRANATNESGAVLSLPEDSKAANSTIESLEKLRQMQKTLDTERAQWEKDRAKEKANLEIQKEKLSKAEALLISREEKHKIREQRLQNILDQQKNVVDLPQLNDISDLDNDSLSFGPAASGQIYGLSRSPGDFNQTFFPHPLEPMQPTSFGNADWSFQPSNRPSPHMMDVNHNNSQTTTSYSMSNSSGATPPQPRNYLYVDPKPIGKPPTTDIGMPLRLASGSKKSK